MSHRKQPLATVTSVTGFIEAIQEAKAAAIGLSCFRGQRKGWPVRAGIFRDGNEKLLANEKNAVRDMVSIQPKEFLEDTTMFDRLVRMQHYGLPTRLLDVTLNPLVALFQASEAAPKSELETVGEVSLYDIPEGRRKYYDSDAVSCMANLANMTNDEKDKLKGFSTLPKNTFNSKEVTKRLLQFIRPEKPYFLPIIKPEDLFKPYYVVPKMSNRRIIAQSGGFIIFGLKPAKMLPYKTDILRDRIVVGKDAKGCIRDQLAQLGITESTLFPEIEKAAHQIKQRYAASPTNET
jgi:hypothetical protein